MNNLYQISQVSPNSGWGNPELLDETVGGFQIAVTTHRDNRMEVFYIGDNYTLYHVWQSAAGTPGGSFTNRGAFMGLYVKQLAAGREEDGRIHVFYIDKNDNIGHFWEDVSTGAWNNAAVGGQARQITVTSNGDGRLELVYVGMDQNIYHNWQTASNTDSWDWAQVAFPVAKIAVARGSDGCLQIAGTTYPGAHGANAADCGVFVTEQVAPGSSTWRPWIGLLDTSKPNTTISAKDLVLIQRADNNVTLFVIASDDTIRYYDQNGNTWGQMQMFGGMAQQLCFCRDQDGRLELFYVGMDGNAWHNWQTAVGGPWPGSWAPPTFQASYMASTTDSEGQIVLFFLGFSQPPTAQVGGLLGGSTNCLLYNYGRPIYNPVITLDITTDLSIQKDGPPGYGSGEYYGFSLQVNGYSPLGSSIQWQQYVIEFDETRFFGLINNWSGSTIASGSTTATLANTSASITSLSGTTAPAGYTLKIQVNTDALGNATGATYTVLKNGKQQGTPTTLQVKDISGYNAGDLAPMIAYEVVLVGPYNREKVTFSTGGGTLNCYSPAALTPIGALPACAAYQVNGTGEDANTTYQDIVVNPAFTISQSVTLASAGEMMKRPAPKGKGLLRMLPKEKEAVLQKS